MTVENLEIIIYTLQFVVPGYLIIQIVSAVMPRKQYSEGELVVQTIGYSIFNLVIWSWLFLLINHHLCLDTIWFWSINTLAILLTSIVTGFMIGLIRKKEWIRRIFYRLGINLEHPVPRAWDYKFSDGKECWVEVTVANGKALRGYYSSRSFASSDPEFRDIYLEALYQKDSDEIWRRVERTSGVWINPDEVRYIKFYEVEEHDGE